MQTLFQDIRDHGKPSSFQRKVIERIEDEPQVE